jgi:hypothetical protein
MFSITEFSPLSSIPKDHILMVFKAYFDGGNEADSKQYQILTLASLIGNGIHWKAFDTKWNSNLKKHGVPYLHTTDAVSLSGDVFSKRNGWSLAKVEAFIDDCVGIIECHAAIRRGSMITYPGLRPTTVSILLKDYNRAFCEIPELGTPEHICVTQCLARCILYANHTTALIKGSTEPKFQLFFDQNEPFRGHALDRAVNKASRKQDPVWKNVIHNGESDMRDIPGLQAADLLAWSINRQHLDGEAHYGWQSRLLSIDRGQELFDYDRLSIPQREMMLTIKDWKLPRRKASR